MYFHFAMPNQKITEPSPVSILVVLATQNPGKQREFSSLFADAGLAFEFRLHAPTAPTIESGGTYFENAWIKANSAHQSTGLPSLADDSGLEVDILGGRPGLYSAEYGGSTRSDDKNMRRLLDELSGVPPHTRTARFRCVLCLVESNRTLFGEGICEGWLDLTPRGTHGFGYDPIFIPKIEEYTNEPHLQNRQGQTLAEMPQSMKNRLSHRKKAVEHLRKSITNSLK